MVRKHRYTHPDMMDDAYMLTRAAQALRKRAKAHDLELDAVCRFLDDVAAKIRAERAAREGEDPAHEITAVRLVRGAEKVWCRCGAVLPIEHNGDGTDEAVSKTIRQHLAEQQDG